MRQTTSQVEKITELKEKYKGLDFAIEAIHLYSDNIELVEELKDDKKLYAQLRNDFKENISSLGLEKEDIAWCLEYCDFIMEQETD